MDDTYMSFREQHPRKLLGASNTSTPLPQLCHRYESQLDLTNVPRQSADWAGGGLISSAQDLSRFIRGLAEGSVFGDETDKAMRVRHTGRQRGGVRGG
jgi:hypothetical protein